MTVICFEFSESNSQTYGMTNYIWLPVEQFNGTPTLPALSSSALTLPLPPLCPLPSPLMNECLIYSYCVSNQMTPVSPVIMVILVVVGWIRSEGNKFITEGKFNNFEKIPHTLPPSPLLGSSLDHFSPLYPRLLRSTFSAILKTTSNIYTMEQPNEMDGPEVIENLEDLTLSRREGFVSYMLKANNRGEHLILVAEWRMMVSAEVHTCMCMWACSCQFIHSSVFSLLAVEGTQ